MSIAGYIASIFVGISLGLIGGGGSILMVPILVYLFKIDSIMATAYSLFIVGSTSMVGAAKQYGKGLVDFKTTFSFGIPTIITIFLVRKFLVPAIPDVIYTAGEFILYKNVAILLLFAVLMLAASFKMIKSDKDEEPKLDTETHNPMAMIATGVAIGSLTGLVGAGGGFLIIPALVFFAKLPMKTAVGTSLSIIALNSLSGFIGDLMNNSMDWKLLFSIACLSIAGIFIGTWLSNFIPSKKLKPLFGWFVLIMGLYIIVKELFL